ncbi:type-F conjugative transfer system mating-pair stabilization protein TraN [Legionella septentrionalis]|uniref:type-F conjugative transfer system mating-pair stabilization protein TraN n=1 Tax=Legionella septentrionalis TaxID=2498109 RepID=UPI000F8D39BE|nr:type-F conjugative transfer system mating-pair stabilization protein TraN [Legionella septentrionalis]RUQ96657.1 type-F conjugative transfer system mating-pair stabilization protein TraN [Legionella septentrionalis]
MFSRFLQLSLFFLSGVAFSDNTALDFSKLKDYAKSLNAQPKNAMNQFRPENVFNDYNENPEQKRYYQGIENEKTDLSQDATNALKQDFGGKTVVEQFGKNQFEINKNNKAIQQSKLIEEESYAITHGISNERIKCNEKSQNCEIKTHDEICYTSRRLPDEECIKTRKIAVNFEHIHQRADFSFVVHKKWEGIVTVNLVTGAITNTAGGSVPNPVRLNHPCENMAATVHAIINNGKPAYWVSVVGLPSCNNNGLVTLNITQKWKRAYPVQIALTIDANSKSYVSEEHWENGCLALEGKGGLCQIKKEWCTDANSTKVIDGLSVTRDCWKQNAVYSCSSAATDECQVQKEKGCLQLSSQCAQLENNTCSLYKQIYSCQEKVCTPNVECLREVFCRDGDCTQHISTQNDEFGKNIAPLAVVGEAGHEFSQTGSTLFAGHVTQCKIWSWDFIDCCSDKGWGKKLNLAHCRDEDKALGQAKLNYLVHYLGKFCSKKELGICVEHKRTYCVFNSKMARIIQEERLNQLNAGALGSPKHPTCGGLSVNELQAIDLSRVDFVNPIYPYGSGIKEPKAGIASDFNVNSPSPSQTMEEIKRRIQKKMDES